MKYELKDYELMKISWYMVTALKSGRDCLGAITHISTRDPDPNIRIILCEFVQSVKIQGLESASKEAINSTTSILTKLFFHILIQSQKGSMQISKIFNEYGFLVQRIIKLQRKQRELLFTPQFQMWGTLVITFFLIFVLPVISPTPIPTFLKAGRFDLFFAGISIMLVGFILMCWLCLQPKKNFKPMINITFFFSFLGLFVESGMDLLNAWNSSVRMIPFSKKIKNALQRPDLTADRMSIFLTELSNKLEDPWSQVLPGLVNISETGSGLSDFLRWTAERETERWEEIWEMQIRRFSALTIIPLMFFIFPGAMYLLIGPQLLEIQL